MRRLLPPGASERSSGSCHESRKVVMSLAMAGRCDVDGWSGGEEQSGCSMR